MYRIMYETFSAPDIDPSVALSHMLLFFVRALPHHVCTVRYRTMRLQMHLLTWPNVVPNVCAERRDRGVYLRGHLGHGILNNLLRLFSEI